MPRLSAASLAAGESAIRASEVPMLLGLSPYGGPFALWHRHVEGAGPQQPETLSQRVGHLFEGPTRELTAEREHVRIVANEETRRHRTIPLVATPDGIVGRPAALYEGKARAFRGAWGEPGDPDGVPVDVRVQCAAQRAVWRKRLSLVGVIVGGADPRAYWLEADRELEQAIEEAVVDLWGYVERREPPPVDGTDDAAAWLRRRFARESAGVELVATAEQALMVDTLREAAIGLFDAEDRFELARQRIEQVLIDGGAERLISPAGAITLRATGVTDWKAIADALGELPPDLVAEHTRTNWKAVVETLRPRTELVKAHSAPTGSPRFTHPFTRKSLERSTPA